jgi:hypothetical protein
MAALLLLLAVVGGILVGDLVLENPAAGAVTVLHHPISGYSQGQLLAAAVALGLVVGLLVVGAATLRPDTPGPPPTAGHGRTRPDRPAGQTRARERQPARGAGPP